MKTINKIEQIINEASKQANQEPINNTSMNGEKILIQLAKNIILTKVLEQIIKNMSENNADVIIKQLKQAVDEHVNIKELEVR